MRATLHKFLEDSSEEVYFLHADMWKWTEGNYKIINCGVQEPNMVNIAAGLASQGKKVIIYGVAGFVIYKAYEQIKLNIKGWAENYGSIIFVNAGHNGCYSICGRGHLVNDDWQLMQALDIPLIDPPDCSTFIESIATALSKPGATFVRLGWDGEVWKK